MREIVDQGEFESILSVGSGFVLNLRPDVTKRLHRADCEILKRGNVRWYPKTHFDSFDEARGFCVSRFGEPVNTTSREREHQEIIERGLRLHRAGHLLEASKAFDESVEHQRATAEAWAPCGGCRPHLNP